MNTVTTAKTSTKTKARAKAKGPPALNATSNEDLNEIGVHIVARSKLHYHMKDAAKKKKAILNETTKERRNWSFEYTGEPPPKVTPALKVEINRNRLEMEQSPSSPPHHHHAFEGAMAEIRQHVRETEENEDMWDLIRVPQISTTAEIVEILKQVRASVPRVYHSIDRSLHVVPYIDRSGPSLVKRVAGLDLLIDRDVSRQFCLDMPFIWNTYTHALSSRMRMHHSLRYDTYLDDDDDGTY